MPKVSVGDIQIYYESQGAGEPVVMIMGLGTDLTAWRYQVPALATEFRVVVFDNRGVGRSDAPRTPYSMPLFASDTARLMDALAIGSAHIIGASMGGMIAQEFALLYPERVRSLVLACTHPGGQHVIPAAPEVMAALNAKGPRTPEDIARSRLWLLYTPDTIETRPDLVEEDIRVTIEHPTTGHGYFRQLEAAMAHDAYDRLPQIKAPTLIITGDKDVLVRPENSDTLQHRISGSKLAIIPNAGHGFFVEAAGLTNDALLGFLRGQRAESREGTKG